MAAPSDAKRDVPLKPQNPDIPPSTVLYVRNVAERGLTTENKKARLFGLFSKFGKVDNVRVGKGAAARGQAWITYASVDEATKAKAKLQGFSFLDKPLDVHYAKAPSKLVGFGKAPPNAKRATAPAEGAEPQAKRVKTS